MNERNPDDVQAIDKLVAENARLAGELMMTRAAYEQAQLKIVYLQRVVAGDDRSGANMEAFERLRGVALENAKRGAFPGG